MTMNIQFFKSKKFYIGAAGILAGLILISLISISLVKLTKSNAQKTLNAGFYNLDEKMTKVIEENIKKSEIAKASSSDGLYFPVSMELMVCLETQSIFANSS